MYGLNTALILIVQTLGSLYLLIVLLRFILQLVRADFYNPLSQFIVRATQPLVRPLRRVIPGFGGVDLASLVLAILVQLVLMLLLLLLTRVEGMNGLNLVILQYGTGGALLHLVIWSVIAVASLFLKVFFFAMIISVILSWVAPGSYNPGAQLINQICEPALAPFRRLLPNMGGLDLSPIFAFIAIKLIDMLVINNLAMMTGMPSVLAPFL
ncbi:YggT family protein [Pseudomonas duriflava]|uniref:YggT family protein n=1 Tax=Pseudomonas duriflava TaxID=459528 RepID=A0A562QNQ3_9PSED|nr:YggT family protein [Pseudomonas duriflava]TWI58391.1 YggT family protein [Pseudomonas duriflava]